jgi:hypothetical protein
MLNERRHNGLLGYCVDTLYVDECNNHTPE